MKKRNVIIVIFAIALLVAIGFLLSRQKIQPERDVQTVEPISAALNKPTNTSVISAPAKAANQQVNIISPQANMDKWKWLHEMERTDIYFEYKAPISFYGRVIDESNNPIEDVSVALSWMDGSEATGTSSRTVISDNNGYFSIEGIHGKELSVADLTKLGYTKSLAQNTFAFNYGWFSDPSYFSPDPNNPVIFVMHKDGPKEPLVKVDRRFPASTNQPVIFNLGEDASTSIRIDILQNQSEKAGKGGAWMIQISVPNGGIQVSTNEFPIEAPETGYEPSIVVDRGTPKPEMWILAYLGGQFFVKTATGYGMIHLEMMQGSPHIAVVSYYNPNNSPNLQP